MQFSHTEIIVLMFFLLSFVLPECEERLLKLLLTTLLLPSFLPSVNHKRTGWLVDTHYTLTQSARLLALRHFRDFPNGTHDTQREIRCFPDFFLFSSFLFLYYPLYFTLFSATRWRFPSFGSVDEFTVASSLREIAGFPSIFPHFIFADWTFSPHTNSRDFSHTHKTNGCSPLFRNFNRPNLSLDCYCGWLLCLRWDGKEKSIELKKLSSGESWRSLTGKCGNFSHVEDPHSPETTESVIEDLQYFFCVIINLSCSESFSLN